MKRKIIIYFILLLFSLTILYGEKKDIIIGFDKNYPPHEFIDKDGNPQGFNIDIIKAILSDKNYNLVFKPLIWSQAEDFLKNKKVDILFMTKSNKREKMFLFSKKAFLDNIVIIVVRENTYYITTIEDLKGHTVCVEKGDISYTLLRNRAPDAIVIFVDSAEKGLSLVNRGEVCAFVGNEYTVLYIIKNRSYDNLKITGSPITIGERHIVVNKSDKELLKIINNNFDRIMKNGIYYKIKDKWFGFDLYKNHLIFKILNILLIVIGSLIIIIFGVILWNKSLKKEVAKKLDNLNKSEKRYFNLIANSPIAILTIDSSFKIININQEARKLIKNEDIENKNIFEIDFFNKLGKEKFREFINKIKKENKSLSEIFSFNLNNNKNYIRIIGYISDQLENDIYITFFMIDMTELEKTKEQLIYSGKMEAIGRFVSGITHDFNNIITGILSLIELIKESNWKEEEIKDDIEAIESFANKAVALTQKLLQFTKNEDYNPIKVDLNNLIEKNIKILKRIVKENIEIKKDLSKNLYKVKIDPIQFEQIMLNLANNSIDAIEAVRRKGYIKIVTRNVEVTESNKNNFILKEIKKGKYVLFSFSDNGIGMSEEIQRKIFDPFFTTKKKGTGFGLSIVYSIVSNNDGYITVDSEINKGTTFNIYFPAVVEDNKSKNPVEDEVSEQVKDKITVLIIEDNEEVKNLIHRNLKLNNMDVFSFTSGLDALKFIKLNPDIKFDLLIVDLILKDITGRELANEISKFIPDIEVLFMSGYTENIIEEYGIASTDINFIQKPFTIETLLDKINKLIKDKK